ncbi:MAG: hypothetical protein ACRDN6_00020 [Gaiellaceae bacterium]
MTLIGAAAAGLLLWLATQFETDATGEYWTWLGLVAAAGLVMAFSQLLGGWTKWGWPRVSGSVFLLGFLPGLVAGGLVLLHAQPDTGSFGAVWAGDLGLGGLAEDLTAVLPAIAFALGLLLGLTFDTTGPGVREVTVEEQEARRRRGYVGPVPVDTQAADEPVTAERSEAATAAVDRDRDGVDDRDEAYVGSTARDEDGRVEAGETAQTETRRRSFFKRD